MAFRYTALMALILIVVGLSMLALLNPFAESLNWERDGGFWIFPVVAGLVYLVPGVIVLLRSDWHPVGWVLCHLAVGFNFSFAPEIDPTTPAGEWWAWLTYVSTQGLFWAVWAGLILVFPNRLAERPKQERRFPWAVFAINTIAVLLIFFREDIPVVEGTVESPIPFGVVPGAVGAAAFVVPLVMLPLVLGDFVRRYRRARSQEQLQYRWVVWAFVYVGATLAMGITASLIAGHDDHPVWLLLVAGYLLVPASFMVSILKYRLYSIDKIVSRTLTYATVAVLVGLIYVIPVLVLAQTFGGSNDFVIAASTLTAAAAFSPIRRWAQRIIDRRFNRARYNAGRVVDDFAAQLRDHVDLSTICDDLELVVGDTVEPTRTAIWLRETDRAH